ncbi:hypothetical protein NDU88_002908 [Pleurodeles waltl]|uniref:Acrosin n=1 Tax=Pleurodeles waltl TaxID=8319 RepID=A0AAV7SFK6_PLEWA|nr:hypothetical protein NDU88_002908 [Pleurodeles waltl]
MRGAFLLSSVSLLWIIDCSSTNKQFCGERPLVGERGSRIVGGTDAKPGTWPWLVSIQQPSGGYFSHLCGGTLFSTGWVLTASHCFKGEERNVHSWRVVTGANQLSELGPETQIRKFKKLYIHENYDPETEKNDIALIEMDRSIAFNDYTQPACFPDHSMDVPTMSSCHVSGWGVMEEGSNEAADILQEASVEMIPVSRCNSSQWYDGAIGIYNLCAGYEKGGVDSCQGDSGGPLMCKDTESSIFYVVGVTSWGRGCAQAHSPGVYSSTQYFRAWILKTAQGSTLYSPPSVPAAPERNDADSSETVDSYENNINESSDEIWHREETNDGISSITENGGLYDDYDDWYYDYGKRKKHGLPILRKTRPRLHGPQRW